MIELISPSKVIESKKLDKNMDIDNSFEEKKLSLEQPGMNF